MGFDDFSTPMAGMEGMARETLDPAARAAFQAMFGIIAGFYIFLILLVLAVGIYYLVTQWKLYEKAGEAGWAAIIPLYREWVKIRIALGRTSAGWFVLSLIPLVNLVENYYISFYFAKRFSGKDSIALLHLLLPIVTSTLMAFSPRYQYIRNRAPEDSGRGGIDGDWPLWADEEVMHIDPSEQDYSNDR